MTVQTVEDSSSQLNLALLRNKLPSYIQLSMTLSVTMGAAHPYYLPIWAGVEAKAMVSIIIMPNGSSHSMASARFNPAIKAYYERLSARLARR